MDTKGSVLYELFGAEGVGQLEKLACALVQKEAGIGAAWQALGLNIANASTGAVNAASKAGSRFLDLLTGAEARMAKRYLNSQWPASRPGAAAALKQLLLRARLKQIGLIGGLGAAAAGGGYLALRKKPEKE